MRSNRNDCALASSASPRDSANDECRWQSMKPGVATVRRPSITCLPANRFAISATLSMATILPWSTATDASRMTRRWVSIVINQSISAMSRSTDCTLDSVTPPVPPRHAREGGHPVSTEPAACSVTVPECIVRCLLDCPLSRAMTSERLLVLSDIGEVVGDLELDQHILVGRVLAQHGAVSDPLGDEQHVAGMHDLHAHLGLPLQRALDAEDDLVGVDVPMPEAHVVLAPLADIHLHLVGGVETERRAIGLVDVRRRKLLVENIEHPENLGHLQHAGVD